MSLCPLSMPTLITPSWPITVPWTASFSSYLLLSACPSTPQRGNCYLLLFRYCRFNPRARRGSTVRRATSIVKGTRKVPATNEIKTCQGFSKVREWLNHRKYPRASRQILMTICLLPIPGHQIRQVFLEETGSTGGTMGELMDNRAG